MFRIKLTSKRQATLPVQLCRELGLEPGDTLLLEPRTIDGESAWLLRTPKPDWSWAGSLGEYAQGKRHEWSRIERSIQRGKATGGDRT
jgi:bifunctional DNA-binding transcriptional regulator/antitoxin component of YhaV-PrlF toxin-antitoxin module